ncbi:hypothetical protein PRK78_001759 [Emydomyces testavorans]|uniref:Small ribosomal subunit protein mS33 n=1 Tax=Emydomyces testavorans TaxID=2070801 RepID=A0AAF0DEN7_9EURO|nr:hypothetical protein PRK78_001759 [Emydomyces testavorans]
MASVARSRILALAKNFNPEGARLGNKVLRQRLRGPILAAYYPRKTVSFRDLQDAYRPFDLETWDDYEEDRLEALQIAKMRGKGAPKKKRTAAGEILRLIIFLLAAIMTLLAHFFLSSYIESRSAKKKK